MLGERPPGEVAGLRFFQSAFGHGYTEADAIHAYLKRVGDRVDWPRKGSRTVVGPDLNGNPIVVMINVETKAVYHIFRYEKKHRNLLWRTGN